jgi:hypothetical protein
MNPFKQTIKIDLPGHSNIKYDKSDVQVKLTYDKVLVTGVPKLHVLEYVARDAITSSKFYVVHRPEEHATHDSYRLHIGVEGKLVEAKVETTMRFVGDGGTIFLNYSIIHENRYTN